MLALAHHIEMLIDAGELADYAQAARALGLTRARITQVMNLLMLSPSIQEQLAVGDLPLAERLLRRAAQEPNWSGQMP